MIDAHSWIAEHCPDATPWQVEVLARCLGRTSLAPELTAREAQLASALLKGVVPPLHVQVFDPDGSCVYDSAEDEPAPPAQRAQAAPYGLFDNEWPRRREAWFPVINSPSRTFVIGVT